MRPMPMKAKVMVGMAVAVSLCALWFGVASWRMPRLSEFAVLLVAGVLSSRLKVKLPGMTSTMSGNLPVILLGVTQLGLLGSLLVAAAAALAQSYSGYKPRLTQLLFNVCTLTNACALAYVAYHSKLFALGGGTAISLTVAAGAYFLANTAPVAGIIGLTEGSNPVSLWHKVFLWSFPNYVIGAGLSAIASAFTTATAVVAVAMLMPVLFAVYQCYKLYTSNGAGQSNQEQVKLAMAAAAR